MNPISTMPKIAESPSTEVGCRKERGTQTFWMSRDELMLYFERTRERHRGARKTGWSKSRFGINEDQK